MKNLGDLLLIKPGEGRLTVYFMLLFICLGVSMSIARGSADALFLRRYGVENLAFVYLVVAAALAIAFTVYAAYVDRIASEKFFRIIFLIQLFVLLLSWFGMHVAEYEFIYPVYYVLYSLSSQMLWVHAAFYLGQNLDTLQSKRLTSVIFSGYPLGMIVGGLILIFIIASAGLNLAPIVWGGVSLLTVIMLVVWHSKVGVSPYYFSKGKSRTGKFRIAINEITKGLEFTRSTELLKNASWALFFLVITFYLLTYISYTIFSDSFDNEAEITRFFGVLVIATNLFTIMLQLLTSSRVIERFGVRKAKLIYPLTTIASFVLFIFHPGFLAALFASFNRESIMPAFRNPAREMFFNVLPVHMRGRSRAISMAIVMPAALFLCGILIILMQKIESLEMIAWAGIILSGMYLLFCVRMGKNYLSTLIGNLRGKLFLSENAAGLYRDKSDSMLDELTAGLNSADDEVSLSYARALVACFPERAGQIIIQRVHKAEVTIADQLLNLVAEGPISDVRDKLGQILEAGDDHLKATVYAALFRIESEDRHRMVSEVLNNTNPRICCAAVMAAVGIGEAELFDKAVIAWQGLLKGDDESFYAAIELIPCLHDIDNALLLDRLTNSYTELLSKYILTVNQARRIAVYKQLLNWDSVLPEQVVNKIFEDLNHYSPKVRVAAFEVLKVLPETIPVKNMIWKGLDDGHQTVRDAALVLVKLRCNGEHEKFFEWINADSDGTPRAHKTLLEELVNNGGTNTMLQQLAETKTIYATELLSALQRLKKDATDNVGMVLLRTLLEERFLQVVDLALLAVQPLLNSNSIAVIRAGIVSRDSRCQSDALEALSCIDDSAIVQQLGVLVGGDEKKISQLNTGKTFADIKAVIKWCIDSNDDWIRENGLNSQKLVGV